MRTYTHTTCPNIFNAYTKTHYDRIHKGRTGRTNPHTGRCGSCRRRLCPRHIAQHLYCHTGQERRETLRTRIARDGRPRRLLHAVRLCWKTGTRTIPTAHYRIGRGRQHGKNDTLVHVAKGAVYRHFFGQREDAQGRKGHRSEDCTAHHRRPEGQDHQPRHCRRTARRRCDSCRRQRCKGRGCQCSCHAGLLACPIG